jgi:deoxyribodipyrimidine photo-lyase
MKETPELRIHRANEGSVREEARYVLYWMTAHRRLGWNFALQRAVRWARDLSRPLVILEILKVDYPYASHRLHRFMLDGMAERRVELESGPVFHYPFVEREAGEGRGLLRAVAGDASVVVVDEFPTFILPELARSAAQDLSARVEVVDSNGLLPLRAVDRTFTAAYHFRRFLQKTLPEHLGAAPEADPLSREIPDGSEAVGPEVLQRWPRMALDQDLSQLLSSLPVDASIPPSPHPGGTKAARARLRDFLEDGLGRYHEDGNDPDEGAVSGLSPYLHFGNIASHEIFAEVTSKEGWTPVRLADKADGSRKGWWGMGEGAEAFLDQLVTWRELGFNTAFHTDDYHRFEALPDWARETLADHEGDERPHLYSYQEFREARTHDDLWNAAQHQLLEEGVIHNYLRMLWGKKILEWSRSPREALETMLDLNDRFALDGRDPNSYSGILWCLGRYDRGWQERPVFGKVRSMSSDRTRKKVRLQEYLRRYGSNDRE